MLKLKKIHGGALLLSMFVVLMQGCILSRVSDKKARDDFDKAGVAVSFEHFFVDGHDIHYATAGKKDKPTLFFIHGSPSSWFAFANYMQDTGLLQHFRIISVDRPGFGDSDFGDATSISKQAEILGPLLGKLQNGQPFFLIGHSLGGPLAVKLSAMYPKSVNGLVLLAASVDPDEERPENWRQLFLSPPLDLLVPLELYTSNKELWDFKEDVKTIPADLHHILCPVFIIQGLSDHEVTPGNGFYAAKELINARSVKLITIEEGHHNIPWAHYEEVKDALLCLAAQ